MAGFGRKGLAPAAGTPARVGQWPAAPRSAPSIIVPARVLAADAAEYELASAVVDFVNHALRRCGFERSELPQEALWAFHLDFYCAQVNNGGHGQFAHNSGWHDFILADIRAALRAIGLPEAAELFERFTTFALLEPARFAGVVERSGFGDEDEFVSRLDDAFFAGIGAQLATAARAWIARLPMLEVVPDADYPARMDALAGANPQREQRLAERERAARAAEEADPVRNFVRQVCRLTPGGIRFKSVISGQPVSGGGTEFTVDTEQGITRVFIIGDRTGVWFHKEEKPRSRIPLAMVEAWMARAGLPALPANMRGEH